MTDTDVTWYSTILMAINTVPLLVFAHLCFRWRDIVRRAGWKWFFRGVGLALMAGFFYRLISMMRDPFDESVRVVVGIMFVISTYTFMIAAVLLTRLIEKRLATLTQAIEVSRAPDIRPKATDFLDEALCYLGEQHDLQFPNRRQKLAIKTK